MPDPLAWPTLVLPPQSIMFARGNMSRSGGPSVIGNEQVVVSYSDRWTARLTTKLTRMDQVLRMRGLMAAADGRANTWLIPTCSGFQTFTSEALPRAVGFDAVPRPTFSDAATFSDGSTFAEQELVLGTLTAPASIGARSIVVHMTDQAPQPSWGQYFSIGQRLYVIVSCLPDPGGAADTYDIEFRPGLRAVASIGEVVDFSKPACLMRLATDGEGAIDLDLLRFASVTLNFVEAA